MAKSCSFRVRLYLAVFLTLGVVVAWPAATVPMETAQRGMLEVSKGVFLVADPRLKDPNFAQTVILIIAHGPMGSSGLIINRPTETRLSRALPDIKELVDWPDPLYVGGPVSRDRMVMLLQRRDPLQSAMPIFDDVYFSESLDELTDLLSRQPVPANTFRMYAGYAGWAPNQLQAELDRGDWKVIRAYSEVIFGEEYEKVWPDMIRRSSQRWVLKRSECHSINGFFHLCQTFL